MKVAVTFPVMVRVDNMGAIFMAGNVTATTHMKHMDIVYKNVNKYVEDNKDKIMFVNSADDDRDILARF